ncbi:hypothetical protein KAH94_06675 [bacterium]|nr:hypothetical protein [bacterium]
MNETTFHRVTKIVTEHKSLVSQGKPFSYTEVVISYDDPSGNPQEHKISLFDKDYQPGEKQTSEGEDKQDVCAHCDDVAILTGTCRFTKKPVCSECVTQQDKHDKLMKFILRKVFVGGVMDST